MVWGTAGDVNLTYIARKFFGADINSTHEACIIEFEFKCNNGAGTSTVPEVSL